MDSPLVTFSCRGRNYTCLLSEIVPYAVLVKTGASKYLHPDGHPKALCLDPHDPRKVISARLYPEVITMETDEHLAEVIVYLSHNCWNIRTTFDMLERMRSLKRDYVKFFNLESSNFQVTSNPYLAGLENLGLVEREFFTRSCNTVCLEESKTYLYLSFYENGAHPIGRRKFALVPVFKDVILSIEGLLPVIAEQTVINFRVSDVGHKTLLLTDSVHQELAFNIIFECINKHIQDSRKRYNTAKSAKSAGGAKLAM